MFIIMNILQYYVWTNTLTDKLRCHGLCSSVTAAILPLSPNVLVLAKEKRAIWAQVMHNYIDKK